MAMAKIKKKLVGVCGALELLFVHMPQDSKEESKMAENKNCGGCC